MRKPISRPVALASVTLGAAVLGLAAAGRGTPAHSAYAATLQDAPKVAATPGWSTANSCRLCHRADTSKGQPVTDFVKLNEVDAWEKNDKHHEGFTALLGERSKEMQRRLGWADVSSEARCLSCHAPAASYSPRDDDAVKEGVSCVSCHGAFTEWVAEHGGVGNKAKQEAWIDTPPGVKHDKFGMTDLRDPAVRTATCASCHVGDKGQDRVVTHEMYAAGHPPLPGLEVSTFSTAEPPHWWPMKDVPYLNLAPSALMKKYGVQDYERQKPRFEKLRDTYRVDRFETQHARLVAVGGLVTFREAMRLFAETAPAAKGAMPDFARFDCAACHHDLTVSENSFRQGRGFAADAGRPPSSSWPSALAFVGLEAGDPAQVESRRADLDAGLKRLKEAVGKRPFGDSGAAAEAAKLAAWTDAIIKEIDGRKLGSDDAIRLLRAIAKSPVPDHASARQLAWAFRTIYVELKAKPANDKEITTTINDLIAELGIKFEEGSRPGVVEREVGARLDADEKFRPEKVGPLFDRLSDLLK